MLEPDTRDAAPVNQSRGAPRLLLVSTIVPTLEAFLLPLARHFRSRGWFVGGAARACSTCAKCVDELDALHDIDWSRNPFDVRNWGRAPAQLRRAVEGKRYDLVHVHTPVAGFVTRLALRKNRDSVGGPRVLYTAHGFHFHMGGGVVRNAVYRELERRAGKWTDHLIVINQEDEEAAHRLGIVPRDRITCIPGIGIDVERYRAEAARDGAASRLRTDLGIGRGDRLCSVVAEFTPNKRQEDVVRALNMLRHTRVHVAFAGTGPHEARVRALAHRMHLDDRVHFLGFRQDVPTLLAASDLLILASTREGLPRSVLEAMSVGIPVIGTDVRGTRDLLAKGAGIIVPLADTETIARSVEWVIAHPDGVREMVQRAAERLPSYQLDRILDLHEQVYSAVLAR